MLACISGCRGVIGCKVATGGVLCAKKFALLGLMAGASAKKFALRGLEWVCARNSSPCKPKTGEKCCFQACWASFFAETRLEERCWASFFAIQQS